MNKDRHKVLAINPGSTSTKVAIFENYDLISEKTIRHSVEDFAKCEDIMAQRGIRTELVMNFLEESNIEKKDLSAVVGRGGLLKPIPSGTYEVNESMLEDLSKGSAGKHASSLGAIIADEIGKKLNIPAYIVDPVVVDEMEPVAKVSGLPGVERISIFHALNTKAVARSAAEQMGIKYEDARFVVAHMGGGITVGAHRYGRVIDVNDGLNGDGCFSPERTGGLPLGQVIDLCFSGKYSKDEIYGMVTRNGGMKAYLGTHDLVEVENRVKEGDSFAGLIMDAMSYQICKEIGAMVAVLEGKVDAIILTGGLAYSTRFTGTIKQRIDEFAQIIIHAGEDEMSALAKGALRVLLKEIKPSVY